MSELNFADVKVHNEIEYCTVWDQDVKMKIERAFLNNRISYYEKWEEPSFLQRLLGDKSQGKCTLCINGMQVEKATQILNELQLDGQHVEMVMKRVDKTFF